MLEKKGLIEREVGVSRSMEIIVDRELIPKWKGRKMARVEQVWARSTEEADRIAERTIDKRKLARKRIV
jgi:hypothetical protein